MCEVLTRVRVRCCHKIKGWHRFSDFLSSWPFRPGKNTVNSQCIVLSKCKAISTFWVIPYFSLCPLETRRWYNIFLTFFSQNESWHGLLSVKGTCVPLPFTNLLLWLSKVFFLWTQISQNLDFWGYWLVCAVCTLVHLSPKPLIEITPNIFYIKKKSSFTKSPIFVPMWISDHFQFIPWNWGRMNGT